MVCGSGLKSSITPRVREEENFEELLLCLPVVTYVLMQGLNTCIETNGYF